MSNFRITRNFNSKYILVGIIFSMIAALAVCCIMLVRRNRGLGQELAATQGHLYEVLLATTMPTTELTQHPHNVLEEEPQEEVQEEPKEKFEEPHEDVEVFIDPLHYRVVQHVLDVAPEMLWEIFNKDVELNEPESFIMLPNDRILISGQWFCTHFGITRTLDAIFQFSISWNDAIRLNLLNYSPFGWDTDWRTFRESSNRYSWVRYHELETVSVRFYGVDDLLNVTGYRVEYLSGEIFSEQLIYYTLQHLNRIIVDTWFVGRILYVNLHHNEVIRMSSGTTGEAMMASEFFLSMSSVPGIDALVIMIGGQREPYFGGHGKAFRDIYLIND